MLTRVRSIGVTRAIGDVFFKDPKFVNDKLTGLISEPAIKEITLIDKDQFLIIACDGVWNVLRYQTVVNFVLERADMNLEALAREITELALANGSTDNISVIIVRLA